MAVSAEVLECHACDIGTAWRIIVTACIKIHADLCYNSPAHPVCLVVFCTQALLLLAFVLH